MVQQGLAWVQKNGIWPMSQDHYNSGKNGLCSMCMSNRAPLSIHSYAEIPIGDFNSVAQVLTSGRPVIATLLRKLDLME